MIKEGKFGTYEIVSALYIVTITKVFFTAPAVLANIVGNASWYMTYISALIATLGFTFIYFLLKRFPDKNLIEIFELNIGKAAALIFSLVLSVFFLLNSAITLREFTEVLKAYVMPLSPVTYIIGIFVSGIIIASLCGLEAIVRTAKLSVYVLIFGIFLVLILSWSNYDINHMFPIEGIGLKTTLYHGVVRCSIYGDVISLAIIAPCLQGVQHIKKAGYITIWLSVVTISLILICFTLVFPYYTSSEMTAPMYEVTTLIYYGSFFQRLDPVFLFVWNIGALISVTFYFYISVSTYCKAFNIDDTRPIIFPLALILFSIAVMPKNADLVITGFVQQIREYGWTVQFVLPLIALIVAMVRRKGENSNA